MIVYASAYIKYFIQCYDSTMAFRVLFWKASKQVLDEASIHSYL